MYIIHVWRMLPLLGLLFWWPAMRSSHPNSFEDRPPVDEIYWCPNFKWISVTDLKIGPQGNNPRNFHWGDVTYLFGNVGISHYSIIVIV